MHSTEIFTKAESIRDVIRYIKLFKSATLVIHIDDSIIDSPSFASHIRDICFVKEAGLKIIIVPAARKQINHILNREDISWKIVNGCRVTEEDAMPLIKMAAFDVSNRVMTSFAAEKTTAVIGNWVRARGKGIQNGIDFGTSGEIDKIQVDAVSTVLENGFVPIFPCIGWSLSGKPYNISSMQLAAALSVKMKADKLFFLTQNTSITNKDFDIPASTKISQDGHVLALNVDELPSFININEAKINKQKKASPEHIENLQQSLSLLRLGLTACRAGVSRVHILNGSYNGTIPCELFSNFGSGTMIYEDNYGGIRNMTIEDIPDVLNVMRPFIEDGILLPRTESDLSMQYNDYIVYELDGSIKACAALHIYKDNQAEIAAVAVDNRCSHIGVGPKLVNFLIEKAREKNLKTVFVLTTRTADWFEQLGFESVPIDSLPEERKKKWSPERGSKALSLNLM